MCWRELEQLCDNALKQGIVNILLGKTEYVMMGGPLVAELGLRSLNKLALHAKVLIHNMENTETFRYAKDWRTKFIGASSDGTISFARLWQSN